MGIGYGLYKASFASLWRDIKKLDFLVAPVSIGLFPVLSLYARNIAEVSVDLIFQPVLIILLASTIGTSVLVYVYKNRIKASIVVSLFWVFFYSYIPIVESGYGNWPNLINLDRYLISFWILLLGLLAYAILSSVKQFKPLYQFFTVAGLAVVLIQFVSIGGSKVASRTHTETIDKSSYLTDNDVGELMVSDESPDIYYILPDSYPRSDTLQAYFDFNNDAFNSFLESKGFNVNSESYSNYNHTALTVPATLNMSYFKDSEELDTPLLLNMYKSNNTFDALSDSGYNIINNSTFFATVVNEYADFNVDCNANNEFMTELLNSTPLKPLSLVSEAQRGNKREDALCTIRNISADGDLKGKRLVFTHMLPPHPPYLFDENGNDTSEVNLSLDGWTRWLAKESYIEQLKYINSRLKEIVSKILNDDPNSVIIIQSDHGTLSSATEAHNLSDTRDIVLKERSRNYTAIYLPDSCQQNQIYDSMTNVNTFRVIFNSCFGAGIDLLEDSVFYAQPGIYTAPFRDITDVVQAY